MQTQHVFSKQVIELQERLGEITHALPCLDRGIEAGWRNLPDQHPTWLDAVEDMRKWQDTMDLLEGISAEVQALELHYYQKLFFPKRDTVSIEDIIHMPIVINFAIVRAEWVLSAMKDKDEERLNLLTRHELTFKTIAEKIGASAKAVAHWHKPGGARLTKGMIPFVLADFYGLPSLSDAWFYRTETGEFIPYRLTFRMRHLAFEKRYQAIKAGQQS